MRANSFAFWVIASLNADSFGAIAVSTAATSGVLRLPDQMPKIVCARLSGSPVRSSATIVLAKVGGAGLLAMASISRLASAMPVSRAGVKSATRTVAKFGSPPYGPVHGARIGLAGAAASGTAARLVAKQAAASSLNVMCVDSPKGYKDATPEAPYAPRSGLYALKVRSDVVFEPSGEVHAKFTLTTVICVLQPPFAARQARRTWEAACLRWKNTMAGRL